MGSSRAREKCWKAFNVSDKGLKNLIRRNNIRYDALVRNALLEEVLEYFINSANRSKLRFVRKEGCQFSENIGTKLRHILRLWMIYDLQREQNACISNENYSIMIAIGITADPQIPGRGWGDRNEKDDLRVGKVRERPSVVQRHERGRKYRVVPSN